MNQDNQTFIERRQTPREGYFTPIQCYLSSDDKVGEKAISYNLSEGGLGVILNEPKNIGSHLEISLFLPNLQVPLEIKVKVISCNGYPQNSEDKQEYEIGLAFLDLSDDNRLKIRQYLAASS